MVNSEEIVERTFYASLLSTAIKMGLTLNPDDYLPISQENEDRFNKDKANIENFVSIFGVGNNQTRGAKECPRITLDLQSYYPGMIGMEKYAIENNTEGNYNRVEHPFETKDITIDVHLVANNMPDLRLLHNIMYMSLPARGYLVPYLNNFYEWVNQKVQPTCNIYIEIGNYYDYNDKEHGILEKVYSYTCNDSIIDYSNIIDGDIKPINDIITLIGAYGKSESDMTKVHIPQ